MFSWGYNYLLHPNAANMTLWVVGIKVNVQGEFDTPELINTGIPMTACTGVATLPKCDCCKIYYYGFFQNNDTFEVTDSVYLGTCSCKLENYDPTCLTCVLPPEAETVVIDECPVYCGGEIGDGDVRPSSTVTGINIASTGLGGVVPGIPRFDESGNATGVVRVEVGPGGKPILIYPEQDGEKIVAKTVEVPDWNERSGDKSTAKATPPVVPKTAKKAPNKDGDKA